MKRRRRSRGCPSMRPLHQTTWLYSPRSPTINIMSYTKSIWSRCYLQRNNQKSSRGSNRSMRDIFRKVKRWVIKLRNDLPWLIGSSYSLMMSSEFIHGRESHSRAWKVLRSSFKLRDKSPIYLKYWPMILSTASFMTHPIIVPTSSRKWMIIHGLITLDAKRFRLYQVEIGYLSATTRWPKKESYTWLVIQTTVKILCLCNKI